MRKSPGNFDFDKDLYKERNLFDHMTQAFLLSVETRLKIASAYLFLCLLMKSTYGFNKMLIEPS